MDKQVNVAVVGAGYWGEKLIGEYLRLSEKSKVKLSAIVDISEKRLSYVKNKYNLHDKIFYYDFQQFLKNDYETDAVHIATPNETHYQIALEAIESGKHVLLEKPMTTSSRSAFKLARKAEKKGVVLQIGHIFRFNNAINMAKKLIENNTLGRIYYLNIRWTTYMQDPPERDIIFDLAPHPIDIINQLLEEWPHNTYARARSFKKKKAGLEDSAFIIMELTKDIIAGLALSWIQPGPKTRVIEIVGEKSMLYVDALNQNVWLYDRNNKLDVQVEANNTIEAMISHFTDQIINGSPPICSPLIGALTTLVLEKTRESLEKNTSVTIMLP
jgi:predicted dehydrogenase